MNYFELAELIEHVHVIQRELNELQSRLIEMQSEEVEAIRRDVERTRTASPYGARVLECARWGGLEVKAPSVSWDNVDQYYEGIIVMIREPGGPVGKPGWKCRACGWICVTEGLPWRHDCLGLSEDCTAKGCAEEESDA